MLYLSWHIPASSSTAYIRRGYTYTRPDCNNFAARTHARMQGAMNNCRATDISLSISISPRVDIHSLWIEFRNGTKLHGWNLFCVPMAAISKRMSGDKSTDINDNYRRITPDDVECAYHLAPVWYSETFPCWGISVNLVTHEESMNTISQSLFISFECFYNNKFELFSCIMCTLAKINEWFSEMRLTNHETEYISKFSLFWVLQKFSSKFWFLLVIFLLVQHQFSI